MSARISTKMVVGITLMLLSLLIAGCVAITAEGPGVKMEPVAPAMPKSEEGASLIGTGPDFPMMPTEDWVEIGEGQHQWYAFQFDYDEDWKTPMEIRLYSEPAGAAILTVRNEEQADMWRFDGEHAHLGCCTTQTLNEDADTPYEVWSGDLFSSGTYFIVVEHAKDVAGPAFYRFEMSGDGFALLPDLPTPDMAVFADEEVAAKAPAEMGSGPDFPMMPTEEWVEINEGQYQWYAFQFDYDDGWKNPVEIRFFTEPKDAAILTIRNEEQADMWRFDGEQVHLGCCTTQTLKEDTDTPYAVWAGELDSSGVYYIVVEHAKDMAGPAYYRFEMSGDGVAMLPELPTPEMATVDVEELALDVAPAREAMPEEMMGTGPDFAMEPTEEWVEITSGEYQWYAFKFDFDEDYTEPVEIQLFTEPEDGAVLTVRNAEQAQLWREEGEQAHIGCCTTQTLNEDTDTKYAVWAGMLDSSGTYYIVVEHAKNLSEPVMYRFTITGPGVSY